jgi:hypothetical protein
VDELKKIRKRFEERERLALARLAPEAQAGLIEEHGPDGLLLERQNATRELSAGFFQAGAFAKAAQWFRAQHENLAAYSSWLNERGDPEGARLLREERARMAWGPGDIPVFAQFVAEGCEPVRDLRPAWDAWPALFLAWATIGQRFHPDHWLPRWAEAQDAERRDVRGRHPDAPDAAAAVLVDGRCARAAFWLGDLDAAAAHATRAATALRGWRRSRPAHLAVPEKRVWLHRLEGTVALVEGRERPARLDDAVRSFAKALEAAFFTHSLDWKDLVLLHVTARAGRDDADPFVAAFRESFPHLAHLLAQERVWEA